MVNELRRVNSSESISNFNNPDLSNPIRLSSQKITPPSQKMTTPRKMKMPTTDKVAAIALYVISLSAMAAGGILLATGVGGVLGGLLIMAGTGGLLLTTDKFGRDLLQGSKLGDSILNKYDDLLNKIAGPSKRDQESVKVLATGIGGLALLAIGIPLSLVAPPIGMYFVYSAGGLLFGQGIKACNS